MKVLFPWVGAKQRQLKNLLPILRETEYECYVEPFGGSACVLLELQPSALCVYNDVNGLLVNFFRLIRSQKNVETMTRILETQPKSRAIWHEMKTIAHAYLYDAPKETLTLLIHEAQLDEYDESLVVALAFFYAQITGFGGTFLEAYGGGQKRKVRPRINYISRLTEFARLFHDIEVENLDASECIRKYDAPTTLFYCDPPYDVSCSKVYKTGWSEEKRDQLIETLKTTKGAVVLSCYDNDAYRSLTDFGFQKKQFTAYTSVGILTREPRTETVYLRTPRRVRTLFDLPITEEDENND